MTVSEAAAWEEAEKIANQVSNKFVRLKNNGDKVVIAFVGAPHVERTIWVNDKKVAYTDEHKAKGLEPSHSFKSNAWNRADKVMQIVTLTAATFKDLVKCKGKYGLETKFYEIERRGAKGDTNTKYTILPDVDISPDEMKLIKAATLHDLTANDEDDDAATDMNSHGKTGGAASGTTGAPASLEEAIDLTTAGQLVERAKILPKHILDGFLAQVKGLSVDGSISIKKIASKNLPAANGALAAAEAKNVAELALKNGAPAPAVEADPFA